MEQYDGYKRLYFDNSEKLTDSDISQISSLFTCEDDHQGAESSHSWSIRGELTEYHRHGPKWHVSCYSLHRYQTVGSRLGKLFRAWEGCRRESTHGLQAGCTCLPQRMKYAATTINSFTYRNNNEGGVLTPGVSSVRTTDLLNSFDIFSAPTRGVTVSAVLPMNKIGKLVFPPICEPMNIETSGQHRKIILRAACITFEFLCRTGLPAAKPIVNTSVSLV
jgi:hypothetical protein